MAMEASTASDAVLAVGLFTKRLQRLSSHCSSWVATGVGEGPGCSR